MNVNENQNKTRARAMKTHHGILDGVFYLLISSPVMHCLTFIYFVKCFFSSSIRFYFSSAVPIHFSISPLSFPFIYPTFDFYGYYIVTESRGWHCCYCCCRCCCCCCSQRRKSVSIYSHRHFISFSREKLLDEKNRMKKHI